MSFCSACVEFISAAREGWRFFRVLVVRTGRPSPGVVSTEGTLVFVIQSTSQLAARAVSRLISQQLSEMSTEIIWRKPDINISLWSNTSEIWATKWNDCWLIILCDVTWWVALNLAERERDREEGGVAMIRSCLVLPLLLTMVEGLDTVSLDNIAFRQEASQSLTLGQYKPGTYIPIYHSTNITSLSSNGYLRWVGEWKFLESVK